MRTLTLGFSPCPNDTFIFGALATGKLEIPGFRLEILSLLPKIKNFYLKLMLRLK